MAKVSSAPDIMWIREFLSYDLVTGEFAWAVDRGSRIKAGTRAGSLNGRGYCQIRLGGHWFAAHRLAWLFVYGAPLPEQIDHINGEKSDNRISNLRAATASQNAYNRVGPPGKHSQLKGVTRHRTGRWQATIKSDGRDHYLGLYGTELEAFEAYCRAAERLHGEFARVA